MNQGKIKRCLTLTANDKSHEFSKDNKAMRIYSKYKSVDTVTFCSVKKVCERPTHQRLCGAPRLWLYSVMWIWL